MLQLCYLYLHFTKFFFSLDLLFFLLLVWIVGPYLSVQSHFRSPKSPGCRCGRLCLWPEVGAAGKGSSWDGSLAGEFCPTKPWSQLSPLVLWHERNCHIFTGFNRNGGVHESGNVLQVRDQERLSKFSLLAYLTFHPLNQSDLQHLISANG